MKPFNLEAALRGEPVVTRSGRNVKFGAYNPDAPMLARVIGWIDNILCAWTDSGTVFTYKPDELDLFMKSHSMEKWAIIYSNPSHIRYPYATKEEAEREAKGTPVARVTWEE